MLYLFSIFLVCDCAIDIYHSVPNQIALCRYTFDLLHNVGSNLTSAWLKSSLNSLKCIWIEVQQSRNSSICYQIPKCLLEILPQRGKKKAQNHSTQYSVYSKIHGYSDRWYNWLSKIYDMLWLNKKLFEVIFGFS